MRLFTENSLPRAAHPWRAIRCAGIACLSWIVLAQPAAAGTDAPITAALPPASQQIDGGSGLPAPLSAPDADRYRAIYRLQEKGEWQAADALIGRVDDVRLMGHILAQRYLHPTKYRSAYPELRNWLAKYADHPEAARIYRLALARKAAGDSAPEQPEAVVNRVGNPDRGGEPTGLNWMAGLANWRVGAVAEAARQFEIVASDKGASDWARAGAAYWAARSYLKNHEPAKVTTWLKRATEFPRTFYGQLARRALGMGSGLGWSEATADGASVRALLETRGGARALALLQLGLTDLAEDELHALLQGEDGPVLAPVIMMVAQRVGLPSVSIRLAVKFEDRWGAALNAALYPVPAWKPTGGFTLDPALLFALMRQESGFNPRAESPAGAAGLMQLMPATAEAMAEDLEIATDEKLALFDPVLNLTLAQRYVGDLLKDPNVKGDLMMLAIAYNAGPGNLAKYRSIASYDKDPLLFIESIPGRETRQFIERVLTNYWLYQERLGQPMTSLDALASGGWPIYNPPKHLQTATTADGAY